MGWDDRESVFWLKAYEKNCFYYRILFEHWIKSLFGGIKLFEEYLYADQGGFGIAGGNDQNGIGNRPIQKHCRK